MYGYKYYSLSILLHRVEWKILRLVWIAFYKNEDNSECRIAMLPKDVIKHIIKFVGVQAESNAPNANSKFVLKL